MTVSLLKGGGEGEKKGNKRKVEREERGLIRKTNAEWGFFFPLSDQAKTQKYVFSMTPLQRSS